MKSNVLLYFVILGSVICASSAAKENVVKKTSKVSTPATTNQKFDFLSRRIDKIEANNAIETNNLKTNITRLMKNSEKIDKLLTQLLQTETIRMEMNVSATNENDVMSEIASQFFSLFDSKVKPMMNEMSNQLKETLEKQMMASANEIDAMKEMPSRFSSTCESKIKPIVTHVDDMNDRLRQTLDKADICDGKVNDMNGRLKQTSDKADICSSKVNDMNSRLQQTSTKADTCATKVNTMNEHLTKTLQQADICVKKANTILVQLEKKYGKFNCDRAKKCFRRVDTAYMVIEKRVSFQEASQNCINEGMTLAMFKDFEAAEFGKKELGSMYPTHYQFWVGVAYSELPKKWRWIDGSVVQYHGHYSYVKARDGPNRCGVFRLDEDKTWYLWDDDDCPSLHYALCEKRIHMP